VFLSSWFAGWAGELHGWRMPFYVFGAFGLVLALVASRRLRNERDDAEPSDPAIPASRPARLGDVLRPVLRRPSFYCFGLAWGGSMIVSIGFMTWMPTFLYEKFHLTLRAAALYAVLYHYTFALIGVVVGGRLSDGLAAKRSAIRLEIKAWGWLLGAPFLGLMGAGSELIVVNIALAGFGFFRGFCESNTFAALFDIIPPASRASATGLMISCGLAISSTSPMLLGYIKEHASLGAGLSCLALSYLFSAAVLFLAIKAFFPRDYVPDPAVVGVRLS
jgi:MFS family permease